MAVGWTGARKAYRIAIDADHLKDGVSRGVSDAAYWIRKDVRPRPNSLQSFSGITRNAQAEVRIRF